MWLQRNVFMDEPKQPEQSSEEPEGGQGQGQGQGRV